MTRSIWNGGYVVLIRLELTQRFNRTIQHGNKEILPLKIFANMKTKVQKE